MLEMILFQTVHNLITDFHSFSSDYVKHRILNWDPLIIQSSWFWIKRDDVWYPRLWLSFKVFVEGCLRSVLLFCVCPGGLTIKSLIWGQCTLIRGGCKLPSGLWCLFRKAVVGAFILQDARRCLFCKTVVLLCSFYKAVVSVFI